MIISQRNEIEISACSDKMYSWINWAANTPIHAMSIIEDQISLLLKRSVFDTHTHIYTHTYIYTYTYAHIYT